MQKPLKRELMPGVFRAAGADQLCPREGRGLKVVRSLGRVCCGVHVRPVKWGVIVESQHSSDVV